MSHDEFPAQSRRSFLRLSSYLTGGLVLPLAGTKALAIVNPAQADGVAVAPVAMPASDELVGLRALARAAREMKHETWQSYYRCGYAGRSQQEIVDTIIDPAYRRVADQATVIMSRPVASWADVGELAEIAWLYAPRDDCPVGPRSRELKRGHWRRRPDDAWAFDHEEDLRYSANAALIEAVLTMTGGQRFDMYDTPPINL